VGTLHTALAQVPSRRACAGLSSLAAHISIYSIRRLAGAVAPKSRRRSRRPHRRRATSTAADRRRRQRRPGIARALGRAPERGRAMGPGNHHRSRRLRRSRRACRRRRRATSTAASRRRRRPQTRLETPVRAGGVMGAWARRWRVRCRRGGGWRPGCPSLCRRVPG